MRHFLHILTLPVLAALLLASVVCSARAVEEKSPDYQKQIAPLLMKYCAGCHNREDAEGELALDSFSGLTTGGQHGPTLFAGKPDQSRMLMMLTGKLKPAMPPEDSEQPSEKEIGLIKAWVSAGAKGPAGSKIDPTLFKTPKIALSAPAKQTITSLAISTDGKSVALASYQVVTLSKRESGATTVQLKDHRGNVNDLSFSRDGKQLVAAAGEAGLFGEARLWDVATGKLLRVFRGHSDSIYAVRISPSGKILATGSYDQKIILWDIASGKMLRTLTGHNGAVVGLDFSPDGKMLASASADRTVKLWDVATGRQIDTFGQSQKPLATVAFSPDGKRLAAAGDDHRIRVWSISSDSKEGSNQLLFSRFAHDGKLIRVVYSQDGKTLISSSDERRIKVWETKSMSLRQTLPRQPDWTPALALFPGGKKLMVGRMDGSFMTYSVRPPALNNTSLNHRIGHPSKPSPGSPATNVATTKQPEVEPNNDLPHAQRVTLPAEIPGLIQTPGDADWYRIQCKQGQKWIIETRAARDKSPLDSKIEVLRSDGSPVARMKLQATRDSVIEFRPLNSTNSGVRLLNWEEMELNQYLYLGGEVVKLFRFPRGPDSDFLFYMDGGKRKNFFDTSASTHYLDEACYIVEPHPADVKLSDDGLPVFTLNYENDDASDRRLGRDSRLTFTAPEDGEYLLRLTDTRAFGGPKFKYQLTICPAKPDFKASVSGANPTVGAGSGKRFTVKVDRIDGFDGPVRFDITGLPPGFSATTPLIIEAGHDESRGAIYASPDATTPKKEMTSKIVARATIDGHEITHDAGTLGKIKFAAKPKILVHLELDQPANVSKISEAPDSTPGIITIRPGETVTARLRIERNGFKGRVTFDVDNLPHGVIVDNIGLNGILIPPGATERKIFLSARPWVSSSRRTFQAVAKAEGNQVSRPLLLHIERNENVTGK